MQDLHFLSSKLAYIIELGVEKQLNSSIKYSPFRLFYSLFKKKNPQTIQRIRNMLSEDIAKILGEIDNFDVEAFVQDGDLSKSGMLLRKKTYNIGIRLVKKLGVKMAFRVVRDASLQNRLYNFILSQIKTKADDILENLKYE